MPDADTRHELPAALRADLEHAGYYPDLVADVLDVSVAGEPVQAHLVHAETTFDADVVRRHVTVLVLTRTRLVVAHADDHAPDAAEQLPGDTAAGAAGSVSQAQPYATAATEAVPLSAVRSVVVNPVVPRPERYRRGAGSRARGSRGHRRILKEGARTLRRHVLNLLVRHRSLIDAVAAQARARLRYFG